jgi:hypothetical protein
MPPSPVRIAVDAHGRKRGRQRAGGEHVVEVHRLVAAVEVAHLAVADVDGADGEPRVTRRDAREVDEVGQRVAQRGRRVVTGAFDAELRVRGQPRERVGHEERGDAADDRGQVGRHVHDAGQESREVVRGVLLDACPERAQPVEPVLPRVAGDQRRVDGADRRADHPVGLDTRFVHRLVDAGLVRAERAAALQHQHGLSRRRRGVLPPAPRRAILRGHRAPPVRASHCAVQPPSTGSTAPVKDAAPSLAR